MKKIMFIFVLFTTIGNISNVVAQTFSQIEGTIWEYLWDDSLHRDFIAFVSDNKSFSYSYELDEFEISNYRINDDTIMITTSDIDNTHNERPIISTIYYYKKENNFLILLFTILRYEDGYKREIPSESYRSNKKVINCKSSQRIE